MTANNKFIAQLSSLRFFAAIAVVIFHFGKWSFPFNSFPYTNAMHLAVSFFFVLSGFIMIINYNELKEFSYIRAGNFYFKRLIRIVPLYIIALIVLFFVSFFVDNDISISFDGFIQSLFFLQAWFPTNALSVNFPGWSISVEMFFYLLFPFIVPLFFNNSKISKYVFLFWLVSSIIFLWLFFNLDQTDIFIKNFTKFFPLLHLNQFLIGMMAGLVFLKNKMNGNIYFILAMLFLIVYLPLVPDNFINHNGLIAPIFAFLILGAATSTSVIKKILSWPLLVKGGEASYGIYILQFPVYLIIYQFYRVTNTYEYLGEEGRFYIYLLFLILFCYISSKTLEAWPKKYLLTKN